MKRTQKSLTNLVAERAALEARLKDAIKSRAAEIADIAMKAGLVDLAIDDDDLVREFNAIAGRFRGGAGAAAKPNRIDQTRALSASPAGGGHD